jgi:hypothetical protein
MINDLLQRQMPDGLGPNRAFIGVDFVRYGHESVLTPALSGHRCRPKGCPNGQVAPWNIQPARRLASSDLASVSAGNTARTATGNLQLVSLHSQATECNIRPLGSRPSRKPTGYCGSSYPYTCPHEEHANNDRYVVPSSGRRPLFRRIADGS